MQAIFLLSGEHEVLARAEAKAQNPQATDWQASEKTITCKTDKPMYEHLAFTRQVHEVLLKGGKEEVIRAMREPRPTSKRVSIECVRTKGEGPTSQEARRLIIPWLGRPEADLERPQETYALIAAGEEWFVTRKLWENGEDFRSRKNQFRPAPHPTSLDPKLARAMVNLAGPTRKVLDPFCGSGGLLLEAALMGKEAIGIDIDQSMIDRARRNLEAYGAQAELRVGDATTANEEADAVVTDLPYGRNSKAKDLDDLYKEFLDNARRLTARMVIAFPDLVDGRRLLEEEGWAVEAMFSWKLHRSLKKELFIAARDAPAKRRR